MLSGLPSTAWAVLKGEDPLAAVRAAGTLLPGRPDRPGLVAGALVHTGLSVGWTAVLLVILRRLGSGVAGGVAAGVVVAALDLGVLARHWPAVRELPQLPQWADHVVFGAIVGAGAATRPAPTPAMADALRGAALS